jgi:hypothetical protein
MLNSFETDRFQRDFWVWFSDGYICASCASKFIVLCRSEHQVDNIPFIIYARTWRKCVTMNMEYEGLSCRAKSQLLYPWRNDWAMCLWKGLSFLGPGPVLMQRIVLCPRNFDNKIGTNQRAQRCLLPSILPQYLWDFQWPSRTHVNSYSNQPNDSDQLIAAWNSILARQYEVFCQSRATITKPNNRNLRVVICHFFAD